MQAQTTLAQIDLQFAQISLKLFLLSSPRFIPERCTQQQVQSCTNFLPVFLRLQGETVRHHKRQFSLGCTPSKCGFHHDRFGYWLLNRYHFEQTKTL